MTTAAPRGVDVRVAAPDDHESISGLFAASYRALMRGAYDPAALEAALPLITRANPLFLALGTFFVTEADGRIVGCGGWTRVRPGQGEVESGLGHIRHFATHPDYTGLGIGRALYQACESQALCASTDRFECYASLNAEGFYAGLGFKRLRRITIPLNEAVELPAVHMSRRIA